MINTFRTASRPLLLSASLLFMLLMLAACRGDELVIPAEEEPVGEIIPSGDILGFYLLNEGNMGSNKCSLDFYSYLSGNYLRNIYSDRNPSAIKELGDVGNDLGIWMGRLFAVVNCSHKVEVMDAATGIRLGQVDIPNCRYITFHADKAYVSSYVGPVEISQDAPKGAVYEIDIPSLTITRRVVVGYQPEEMVIADGYLYVANSGGYRAPDYDHTVSVVDLASFRQVRQIDCAINLSRLRLDSYGRMWLTSRGDYGDTASCLQILEKDAAGKYQLAHTLQCPVSNLAIKGDSLLYISAQWSDASQSNAVSYGVIDVRTGQRISDSFITDGSEGSITIPYGLAVHPVTGDIFITDARNYVSSGTLRCYSRQGKLKWSVRTGDIPAVITFLNKSDLTATDDEL